MKFELNRLIDYDNESLLGEIRRVAALIDAPVITKSAFDQHSKVSSDTVRKRFGGWKQALIKAGVGDRYGGDSHFAKGHQRTRGFSDDELIAELRTVAKKLGVTTFTMEMFNKYASINAETVRLRFGSWWAAMKKADLVISNLGKRYSDEDYFENLLTVWTHYGRQPTYGEMDLPPSSIPPGAYEAKWGKWTKALLAFLDRVNSDVNTSPPKVAQTEADVSHARRRLTRHIKKPPRPKKSGERTISLGLRYDVLRRDRFRCVICGANPAANPQCQLHVDHVIAHSKGGRTSLENLRTLCMRCNVGKSDKIEPITLV